ncbi:hypothetical protein D3C72_1176870 [compost metagenome]
MTRLFIVFLVLLTLSISSWGQTSTTTLAAPEATSSTTVEKVEANKKIEDTANITDSKLKAEEGSLSRLSLKFSFSYNGPPVGDLSNKYQPNPDGAVSVNETSLGGAISGRFRLNGQSAISLGTGISFLTPFHGVQRTDTKNPFISYDRSSRLGDLQMRNSVGYAYTTVPIYRDAGQAGAINYDNSVVYNLGTSNVALGLDTSFSYYLFDREYEKKDGKISRDTLGFYPQVKYYFSDTTNVYTSVAFNFWNPRMIDNSWALWNRTISQRVGMGYSYSRDIYFAPYLNFYPGQMHLNSTTISFSTVFSIL